MRNRASPSTIRWLKHLALGVLSGLSLLLAAGPASAQTIVYTDPTDIVVHQGVDDGSRSEVISLDGSGIGDVFFNTHLGGSLRTLFAAVSSPGRIVTTSSAATPLESGATIGPTLGAGQAFGLGGSPMRSSNGGPDFGPWPEDVDRYVGVKMVRQPAPFETHTYYGWVRVSINMTGTSSDITIKDWAYNSTENAPITAGDTGIAVDPDTPSAPEPGSLVLFSAACCGLLALRRNHRTRT